MINTINHYYSLANVCGTSLIQYSFNKNYGIMIIFMSNIHQQKLTYTLTLKFHFMLHFHQQNLMCFFTLYLIRLFYFPPMYLYLYIWNWCCTIDMCMYHSDSILSPTFINKSQRSLTFINKIWCVSLLCISLDLIIGLHSSTKFI